jgi:ubiquinone/menaquinone biosynthesis C-methylase UbiE
MKLEKFFITEYEDGEMLPYERYKLYNWILNSKPNNILEIGCGTCGGSSKFMSDALDELNNGNIFCCDPSRGPSEKFLEKHPRVNYSKIISTDLINYIIIVSKS